MKLFKVLKQLNNRELAKFRQFLASPFFNKRKDVAFLFDSWIAEKKRSHPPKIYWAMVFPDQIYSVTQWNLLCSRLFKLLETFLTTTEVQKYEAQKKFYLAKAYRNLQQEVLFKKAIRLGEQTLEKQSLRSSSYLQEKHDFSFERYDYVISINRKEKTNLQEVSDNLDAYILAAKLRQACNALSRQVINQEEYEIGLLEEVLNYIEENPNHLETPAIAVYYFCYRTIITEDNETYFQLFRKAITKHQKHFPPSEIRDIYTFAINYFIRKLNTSSALVVRETFELYLLSLEQGYLLEDGIMLESTYSNIIWLATKQNKYKWAKSFIEQYQENLKPKFRKPLFHFSLGKLHYEQSQYEKSLVQLLQVETKASFLFLSTRILQIKIYYELGDFDLLESLLESLRVYLQRSKDLAYRKKHYDYILIFTKQLLQMPAMSKKEKEAFRQRINEAEVFSEKDWFLEQIA